VSDPPVLGAQPMKLGARARPLFERSLRGRPYLRQSACPVLAFFGGRDSQTPVERARPMLELSLRGRPYRIVSYPTANHDLRAAGRLRPSGRHKRMLREGSQRFGMPLNIWHER